MSKSIFNIFGAFLAGLLFASVPASAEIVDPSGNILSDSADIGDIDQSKTKISDLKTRIAPGYASVSNAAMTAATAAQVAGKQDKLPYPTNAIPQGAVSGLPASLGSKQDKLPYATNAVPWAVIADKPIIPDISTKQDKLPYPTNEIPQSAVSGLPSSLSAKASTNDVELATQYTDEWNCEPATDENGFRYSIYWNTTYQAWMLSISDGAIWGPEDINATSFTVDVRGQTVTATRVKSYVLGTQDTKPLQPAGNYALKSDIPDISTKQDKLPYPTNAIPQGAVSGLATALAGKADKISNPTNGNLVAMNASGNITNSGKSVSGIIEDAKSAVQTQLENGDYTVHYADQASFATHTDTADSAQSADFAHALQSDNEPDLRTADEIFASLDSITNKASIADATLTDAAAWACNPATDSNGHAYHVEWQDRGWATAWFLFAGDGQSPVSTSFSTDASATRIEFSVSSGSVVATRAASQGFQLGSQTNKILAAETETEALRTNKVSVADFVSSTNSLSTAIEGKASKSDVAAAASAATNYTNTAIAQIPEPDFTSNNATLVATIEENAPAPGNYAAVSNAAMNAAKPKSFVVSPDPSYEYSGGGSIPNGVYYKAVTGEGLALYAAKVPFPKGRIVLSGDLSDDPIVEHFGEGLPISDITTIVSSLGGYEEDGKYSVADLVCTPSALLNLAVVLHTNILNPLPEITGSTMTWTDSHLAITTQDGIQHGLYFPTRANDTTYTYTDNAYDPSTGETTTYNRSLTISYAADDAMDYGVAFFSPTQFATIDQIDTARSRLMERKNRPNELGSGWGYKIYDFKSDERKWELQVPRLTPSVTGVLPFHWQYMTFTYSDNVPEDAMLSHYGNYAPKATIFYGNYKPTPNASLISNSCNLELTSSSIFKELVATSNKYSTAGSQYADWRIGIIPRKDTLETADDCYIVFNVTNMAIGVSGRPYLWGGVFLDNDVDPITGNIKDRAGADLLWSVSTNIMPIAQEDWQGGLQYMTYQPDASTIYTNTVTPIKATITYHDFRVNSITINNYTATLSLGYTATVVHPLMYLKTDTTWGYDYNHMHTYNCGCSFNLVLGTAQNLETYTAHANRVITDYNQHMIYDPGLKCTWEIVCTNGVFFTRKVSRDDYRKVEFVE